MKNNEGKSSTCKVCVTAFMFLMSLCLLLRFSCYYIQLPAFYSKVLSKVCRYSWYTQLTTVTTTEMKAPLRTLFAAVVVTHVSLKLTATKSSSRATEAVILQVAAVYFFVLPNYVNYFYGGQGRFRELENAQTSLDLFSPLNIQFAKCSKSRRQRRQIQPWLPCCLLLGVAKQCFSIV